MSALTQEAVASSDSLHKHEAYCAYCTCCSFFLCVQWKKIPFNSSSLTLLRIFSSSFVSVNYVSLCEQNSLALCVSLFLFTAPTYLFFSLSHCRKQSFEIIIFPLTPVTEWHQGFHAIMCFGLVSEGELIYTLSNLEKVEVQWCLLNLLKWLQQMTKKQQVMC